MSGPPMEEGRASDPAQPIQCAVVISPASQARILNSSSLVRVKHIVVQTRWCASSAKNPFLMTDRPTAHGLVCTVLSARKARNREIGTSPPAIAPIRRRGNREVGRLRSAVPTCRRQMTTRRTWLIHEFKKTSRTKALSLPSLRISTQIQQISPKKGGGSPFFWHHTSSFALLGAFPRLRVSWRRSRAVWSHSCDLGSVPHTLLDAPEASPGSEQAKSHQDSGHRTAQMRWQLLLQSPARTTAASGFAPA